MKLTSPAPLSVWRPLALDDFLVGAPHYPEHVDESYWQRDAERMAAAEKEDEAEDEDLQGQCDAAIEAVHAFASSACGCR